MTTATVAQSPSRAMQPWHRWFARWLDYFIIGILLGILVTWLAPGSFLLEGEYLLGWVAVLLWIPIEALWVCTIGATPGKTLLGLSVETSQGGRLSWQQALTRSTQVWLNGMALMLPLVPLITMNRQYNRLRQGQEASWDAAGGFHVLHTPLSIARKLLLVAVVCFLLLVMAQGAGQPSR